MSADLETLLGSSLGDVLVSLEAERQRALQKVYVALGIAGLCGLFALVSFFKLLDGQISAILFLAICSGGIAICAWSGKNAAGEYSHAFKYLVPNLLVRSIDESLTYSPFKSITPVEFEKSNLFPHRHNRFRGEDLIEGRIGQTQIRFSQIHAEYSAQGPNSSDEWHTIFRGLFFIADFNKNFNGETMVLPDNLTAPLGRFAHTLQALGAKMNARRGDLVVLEDPEFDREFAVYATDQIEARYILSNSLMRRILNFQRKTGRPLYLSFVANKICIAIPGQKNMFEPSIFRSALATAPLEDYLNDLKMVTGLVDELDLNTRIWSKQPSVPTSQTPQLQTA